MYIYENCMGELYTSDEPLDYEDLYCEQCGDSDSLIGYADTKKEAWDLLKDEWSHEYIQEFIDLCWDE